MRVLIATITDLASFAISPMVTKRSIKSNAIQYISQEKTLGKIEKTQHHKITTEHEDIYITSENGVSKNTVMYAGGMNIPLYKNPTREFDGVISKLSYGTMVMVLSNAGRWSKIAVGELTGWVFREDLMDRAAYVYPQFIIGSTNLMEDPNTIRLRAVINDLFDAEEVETSLLSPEYVTYRLMRKGKHIKWPQVRPRIAGRWHQILKGVAGIHISIKPKTDSVMEFTLEDGRGHLAYVEAVFPDETVTISETDWPHDGIYNERVLTQEEWRELKPVFIEVA